MCATANTSYAPRDGYDTNNTTRLVTALDDTPCKTTAEKGTLDGTPRTAHATDVKAHPDGNADNYETDNFATFEEVATTAANTGNNRTVTRGTFDDFFECSEDDGGNDEGPDGDSSCDATWVNDVTVKFMDLTFGCEVEQAITVTCEWNADGGRAVGRNALPTEAINFAGADDNVPPSNLAHFIKCTVS